MAAITAAQVKELRERTGVGMMDCKKALEAVDGDIMLAIEELRKSGRTKADKKAGRVAAEGVILIRDSAMIEVNSETDFAARDENFLAFADSVLETVLSAQVQDVEALMALPMAGTTGTTVEEARQALVAKIGENINVRRIALANSSAARVGAYLHGNSYELFLMKYV